MDDSRPLNNGTRAMTTAANTGAGARDWDTKLRRDEVVRCMGVLGWSWPVLGQRLDIGGLKGALQIKMCKREISDGDLEWLSSLAAAAEAVPRLVPVAATEDDGAPMLAEPPARQAEPTMVATGSTMAAETVAEAEATVIAAVVAQYRAPLEGWDGWSADEVRAARAALSELLARLGWLGRARQLLAGAAPIALPSATAPVPSTLRPSSLTAPRIMAPARRREPFA